MIRFLLHKPIAVTLAFTALLTLGMIATGILPVSLMPDIDIPRITVQVSAHDMSARELENTVVKTLRTQLVTLTQLTDLKSETRDGQASLKLSFEYGTDTDRAFIDVNEKIDRGMHSFPRSVERPRVIKGSATDIPAFYLNITLKHEAEPAAGTHDIFPVSQKFVELSNFARQVISKRIEQLPQVAMADLSGQASSEILVMPDMARLDALGISLPFIEGLIRQNSVDFGNLSVQDGQIQYHIQFGNSIATKSDIENIYFKHSSKILQIKDVARVVEHPQKRTGMVLSDGRNAITLAIIKQSDAQMSELKTQLHTLVDALVTEYPELNFTVTRDQTRLLAYAIDNLTQNLVIGALLAFLVMFFFLQDYKSPVLIGITMPLSLIISLLFFHLAGLSLNIVSLSGLVLGIGMIIDNSIIVIDNITQYRTRGYALDTSCIQGTAEVFRPMLSSVLTTCAVFVPLTYIAGIAGELFYDQAFAVTIGQFVSLLVAVTVVPVYYRILYRNGGATAAPGSFIARISRWNYEQYYHAGFRFTMKNQAVVWITVALMLAGGVYLFTILDKSRLPDITRNEIMLRVDWNENITLEENKTRVMAALHPVQHQVAQSTCLLGEQQFLLDIGPVHTSHEALVYLQATSPAALDSLMSSLNDWLQQRYGQAVFTFSDAGNIFDALFRDEEPPVLVRLHARKDFGAESNVHLQHVLQKLQTAFTDIPIPAIRWQEQLQLKADPALLALYDVGLDQIQGALRRSLRENEVMVLTASQDFVPVVLGEKSRRINTILHATTVMNGQGSPIPVGTLLREEMGRDLAVITGGKDGEYYPVALTLDPDQVEPVMAKMKEILAHDGRFEATFSGSYFSNRVLIRTMAYILAISLLMLYFILASQFESLVLPIIVLLEIPLAIAAVFLFLLLFGESINIMSMIGIVVMSGIVINDSILKIDTINQLRAEGYTLLRAITVAGQRRIKPILMTSLTAILALLPFLFTHGMESDLQRPLSLAIMGGMSVGTLVSLYFIPLLYYYLLRKRVNHD